MMDRIADLSPRFKASIVGVFYSLTFVTGALTLAVANGRIIANLIATASYIAVTVLFYDMFRPVNKNLSVVAAFFGLLECGFASLSPFDLAPYHINPLVFFGFYCLLIGYLIFRSTFLPQILGALMAFGGLGWLTFVSARLANYLSPYNFVPGMFGQGALTLWLLVMGLDVPRWEERARVAAASART